MSMEKQLILASASPRRRELLQKMSVPFRVEVSDAEEHVPEGISAEETAEYLSGLKADAVFQKHLSEAVIVIGSDTVVVLDGIIFGKPADQEDAFRMLKKLSGNTHVVYTGVTILSSDGNGSTKKQSFTSATKVRFYELSDEDIRAYIESGEPMDKAGAYGIQGQGVFFVEKIDGDYNTVVGFPLAEIARRLRENRG